jgi:hypothetical protein
MSESQKCSNRFFDRWGSHLCQNKAKVERDGKPYCNRHDPVACKARDDARRSKWQQKWKEEREQQAKNKRRAEAGELGIELAKFITVSGWKDYDVSVAWNKAHAILDKLEGK